MKLIIAFNLITGFIIGINWVLIKGYMVNDASILIGTTELGGAFSLCLLLWFITQIVEFLIRKY
jgi:hypothetical protein